MAHVARTGPSLYSLVVHDDNPLTSIVDDRYSLSERHLKERRGGSLLHAAFSLIPKSCVEPIKKKIKFGE